MVCRHSNGPCEIRGCSALQEALSIILTPTHKTPNNHDRFTSVIITSEVAYMKGIDGNHLSVIGSCLGSYVNQDIGITRKFYFLSS
jgi:hypothetical protein